MRRWWMIGFAVALGVAASYRAGRATADVPAGPRTPVVPAGPSVKPAARVPSLPLAFEANRGQAPDGYDFLVRCRGYHAFVAPTKVVFSFDG